MIVNKTVVYLVEGNRDIDFVNEVVKKRIINTGTYDRIIPYKYKNIPKSDNEKFIKSLRAIGSDILCMADINSSSSIEERKEKLKKDDVGDVPDNCIVIVIKEIESWYLAGLDGECCRKLRIGHMARTDTIGKEECHTLIAKSKFGSRQACMSEILKRYDIEIARGKNKSFYYFYTTYLS